MDAVRHFLTRYEQTREDISIESTSMLANATRWCTPPRPEQMLVATTPELVDTWPTSACRASFATR